MKDGLSPPQPEGCGIRGIWMPQPSGWGMEACPMDSVNRLGPELILLAAAGLVVLADLALPRNVGARGPAPLLWAASTIAFSSS